MGISTREFGISKHTDRTGHTTITFTASLTKLGLPGEPLNVTLISHVTGNHLFVPHVGHQEDYDPDNGECFIPLFQTTLPTGECIAVKLYN